MTSPAFPARRLGVLISGRGSNLQAIIDAIGAGTLEATIGIVISSRASAPGLARARAAGIPSAVIAAADHPHRDACDAAIVDRLRAAGVELVCLAGYMRLVGRPLLEAYPERILNIHPSLLPSFPGLEAQRQALAHGVCVTGATVHLVDAGLDAGPIVAQAAVPVHDDDTAESLAARILVQEHRIYPEAIAFILGGGWTVRGRRVVKADAGA
ncbi:MAG: phosphoribosylglycinamide formyltransferase [Acidobacteria bacterium]|nr:phosphoribosylglycinamide formyltransferase [Acidobacteriota bacterium]